MGERVEHGLLTSVPGIGRVLATTIVLEAGPMDRFAAAGNFASYARCVDSQRVSNGKKKGEGNTKNGNKYLAWAFIEAANFALRYCAEAKRFYERKKAKANRGNPVLLSLPESSRLPSCGSPADSRRCRSPIDSADHVVRLKRGGADSPSNMQWQTTEEANVGTIKLSVRDAML